MGFPGGSDGKEATCNAEGQALIPGLGRSPGEGNGLPTPVLLLGNGLERGSWRATAHGVTETKLSDSTSRNVLTLRKNRVVLG